MINRRILTLAGAAVGLMLFLILAGAATDVRAGGMRSMRGGPMSPPPEAPAPPRDESAYRSPFDMAFSPDGGTLAVSDRTAGVLYLIRADTGEVRHTVPLRGRPMGVAWRSNSRVLVAEYDARTVAEVDAEAGRVLRGLAVGPKPVGVALAAQKNLLVVCDYGLHTVHVIDLETGAERARVLAGQHPYFVAITPDERMAVVANLLPAGPASNPLSSAVVSLIDLDKGEKLTDITLPDNSSSVRQVRVSPDGRWAYLVHTRGRTMLPTTQLDRGWVNTNALTILDLTPTCGTAALSGDSSDQPTSGALTTQNSSQPRVAGLYATALLDTVTEGAADPWGIALSPDGKTAWITIAGAQQIARIDLARLHEYLAGRGPQSATAGAAAIWQQIKEDPAKRKELSYHLSALYAADLMTRVNIDAQCPRAVAVSPDGRQLAVASYFSGEILLLDPDRCRVAKRISLGPQPEPDAVRHGEFVFHDGRHSFQHWLSCSTCHPDGRADGMNWDLLNDGIGNPKNARSLVWSHQTPPVMSLGVRESMEEAAQKGFQFIQFREIEEGDLSAVRAYLRSMEPEASPHLIDGRLSENALRGKQLFEDSKTGCSHCHPAPLYTSLKSHDVGTKGELDRQSDFDTPTCIELWRTAPYLHDGSAVTLREVLTTRNANDKHGRTSHLSQEEIDALVEYLLSL